MIAALITAAAALRPARAATPRAAPDVQSASATDATERESYLQYNAHAWRGVCRSVVVDATRRRVDYDADLDGKRYSAAVKRRANGDLEERFSWDDDDAIETTLPVKRRRLRLRRLLLLRPRVVIGRWYSAHRSRSRRVSPCRTKRGYAS